MWGKKKQPAVEVKRTCTRCQTVWYVSQEIARKATPEKIRQLDRLTTAARIGAVTSIFSSKNDVRVARYQREKAELESAIRCPNCGSSAYRDELVWIAQH